MDGTTQGVVVELADTEHVDHSGPHGYASDKQAYLKRMRRIEGQVRGIARMIEEDVYCIDVLTQVSAVTKALQAVSIGLVEDHLGHCVVDAAKRSDDEGAAKVREAANAIARLVRS
ncbi:metal-sensitive transcriptional regulator [Cellulosimicrobium arenosum]|uniref:Metal-sensitive transcriptional regulator n=1 Tax=Cellulosimicrobium arenosum TaxID=2708133 RepID=A0A927J0M6_9MICO|nr:metal-sensitive transcriptional regulator [Cellulosimicrobium arenosum]MBD8079647.1 metal-sensitive transcriptional regulator [Cellulosimicrobium arenosum]